MKKKITVRPAKATSRQSTLNFPTSSEADLVAESAAAETSTKNGAKNRRKRTADCADDADKHNETNGDSPVPMSSAPTERNKIAQGKKRSTAALGQHPSTTESPEGATEPTSSAKNRRKRTADCADDADKHNKTIGDSSVPAFSAPTEQNKIAQGKKHSAAALGQHPSITDSPEGATEPSSSAKNCRKRTADSADSSAHPVVENSSTDLDHKLARLPKGWRWVTLREIADISGGITKGQKYRETDILRRVPYLRVANVQRGYLDLTEMKEIDATEAKIAALQLQPGDILFNEGGDRDKLGRGWIWNNELPVCIHQNHVFRARLRNTEHSSRFVSYYSNSAGQRYFYDQGKHTTNLASINLTKLGELPIPLPPPAEQQRIVAEIEKQFTRLDAGVAALKRVQANLKRYRAAVLKAACEGKLVPTEAELRKNRFNAEDAESAEENGKANSLRSSASSAFNNCDFETGEQLLQRILTERRQNWQGRGEYKEPIKLDIRDLPPLPDGWCYASAEQVCSTVASGSTPSASKMTSGSGEVPFLKVYNLTHRGTLNFEFKPTYIEQQTHEGQLARSRVFPCDVLMNIVGPPLGKVSIVPDNFPECNINQAIVVFRSTSGILTGLLAYWLLSEHVLGRLARTAKATAGQFNLQVTARRMLALPIPPLAEQIRIVAEVERRLSVVDELESVVSANLQRATRLRQSILQKAFSGEH